MKSNVKRVQGGFTLVEILVVLGIVLGIMAFMAPKVRQALTNSDVNEESGTVMTMANAIKSFYKAAGAADYNGLTTALVISNKLVPSELISGTAIVNKWGGNITVAAANVGGVANDGFQLTTTNVPSEACSKLVTMTGKNFSRVDVAGTTVKALNSTTIDLTQLGTQCSSASNVTIDFFRM